jgi:hypothetical protein
VTRSNCRNDRQKGSTTIKRSSGAGTSCRRAADWRRAAANLKDLNLTDGEEPRIADIRQEHQPKVHETSS